MVPPRAHESSSYGDSSDLALYEEALPFESPPLTDLRSTRSTGMEAAVIVAAGSAAAQMMMLRLVALQVV